jgi:acyl carrier protein
MTVEPPTAQDPQTFIVDSIRMLLARREEAVDLPVTLDAHLHDDLDLDSLELAELSVLLEDNLGRDPYSEGIVPETVREIVAFYG